MEPSPSWTPPRSWHPWRERCGPDTAQARKVSLLGDERLVFVDEMGTNTSLAPLYA
ncbi:MAG: hypothetical protein M3305_03615 [Actinomycetota bacterium]|nr:hypothetical protein [Actinomycetota bacterium]